jgi:tetratricopeptide (TPR) repeat protein
MADPRLAEARALKRKATALRNRGEFKRAKEALDEAIRVLETPRPEYEPTPADIKEVRGELADTHGMKGGIFRRTLELDKALTAYETGATIEEDDNLSTTYNRSNVITLSITAKGQALKDPEIRKRLASVIEDLGVETAGPRSDEWWAWSDLAQFYLLNGEPDKARASYANAINKTGATASEIKRHVTILGELADKITATAPEIAASIRATIDKLSP